MANRSTGTVAPKLEPHQRAPEFNPPARARAMPEAAERRRRAAAPCRSIRIESALFVRGGSR